MPLRVDVPQGRICQVYVASLAVYPTPISRVGCAPLLMMHGTADEAIPVEQSREYERAALALGKPLVVVYFEGVGHMVSLIKESQAEARQRSIAFLREHLLR